MGIRRGIGRYGIAPLQGSPSGLVSLLATARRVGERNDVPLKAIYVTHASPEAAIERVARVGRYDLVVVGTSLREEATKFLGPRSSALLRNLNPPTLLVTQ
jgi:nucleotide-binding universal stress UspA family protein